MRSRHPVLRILGMVFTILLFPALVIAADPIDIHALLRPGYAHGTYTCSGNVVSILGDSRPIVLVFHAESTPASLHITWASGKDEGHGALTFTHDGATLSADGLTDQTYTDPAEGVAVATGISSGCVGPLYGLWTGVFCSKPSALVHELPPTGGTRTFQGERADGIIVTITLSHTGELTEFDTVCPPRKATPAEQDHTDPEQMRKILKKLNPGSSDEDLAAAIALLQKAEKQINENPQTYKTYISLRFVWH